jgi:hypothetical protein
MRPRGVASGITRPTDDSDEPLAPPPWTRVTVADDTIEYERTVESERREALVQLHACRSSEPSPSGGGNTGWKLQLSEHVDGASVSQSSTYVSSRPEAVQALFGAMRRVNSALRSRCDGHAPDLALPERFGGGVDNG